VSRKRQRWWCEKGKRLEKGKKETQDFVGYSSYCAVLATYSSCLTFLLFPVGRMGLQRVLYGVKWEWIQSVGVVVYGWKEKVNQYLCMSQYISSPVMKRNAENHRDVFSFSFLLSRGCVGKSGSVGESLPVWYL